LRYGLATRKQTLREFTRNKDAKNTKILQSGRPKRKKTMCKVHN